MKSASTPSPKYRFGVKGETCELILTKNCKFAIILLSKLGKNSKKPPSAPFLTFYGVCFRKIRGKTPKIAFFSVTPIMYRQNEKILVGFEHPPESQYGGASTPNPKNGGRP